MIALIQRVSSAGVRIGGALHAEIGPGLLALIGICTDDGSAEVQRILERLLGYRVFPDTAGRMNRSLRDTGGSLLLVPQFTLAADTRKGTRAGFSTAAPPELAARLYDELVASAQQGHRLVASGVFGADMQVQLVNEGPVTFWLES
jgi:D-tyrosyl-tRNA(Tyr) deacylase